MRNILFVICSLVHMACAQVLLAQTFGQLPDGEGYVTRAEGDSVNGLREGPWRMYYHGGTKASEGSFTKGKREGTWTFFSLYDKLYARGPFKNDVREGVCSIYNSDGKLIAEGPYVNGLMEGEWRFTYPSGKLMGLVRFSGGDGSKLGRTGIPQNGRSGHIVTFYESGDTLDDQVWRDGQLDGPFRSFHPNGNPSRRGTYLAGQMDGVWQEYAESGKLRREIEYHKGEDDGDHRMFDPATGRLIKEEHRLNGKLQWVRSYSPNGLPRELEEYDHGRMRAHKCTWYADRTQKFQERWFIMTGKNGSRLLADSVARVWYENGVLREESYYKDDELEGAHNEYHDNGKPRTREYYVHGIKNGIAQTWYASGALASEGSYRAGEQDGLWKEWNEDGAIKSEGYYQDGMKQGPWREGTPYQFADDMAGAYTLWTYNADGYPEGAYTIIDGKGTKREEGEFKDGRNTGLSRQWYANGQLRSEIEHGDPITASGVRCNGEALLNSWTVDGAPEVIDGNGHIRKVQNGILLEEGFYRNGCRDSVWTTYEDPVLISNLEIWRGGESVGDHSLMPSPFLGVQDEVDEADRLFLNLFRARLAALPWKERAPGVRVAVISGEPTGKPAVNDLLSYRHALITSLCEPWTDDDNLRDSPYMTELIEGSVLFGRSELKGLERSDITLGQLIAIEYAASAVPRDLTTWDHKPSGFYYVLLGVTPSR